MENDGVGRRRVLAGGAGLGAALLAGCSGSPGASGANETDNGGFRLLVSDQPAAIGDFGSLDVTLSTARVYPADEEEDGEGTDTPDGTDTPTPTAEGDEEGDEDDDEDGSDPVEFDLDGETVDLTTVVGDRALPVLEGDLPEGRYSRIELVVESAEGVVDGETVAVRVPSGRLRIVRSFTVEAGSTVEFVFDINVVRRGGNGYNLTPVVGKSGVVGEDTDVEEIEAEDGETPDEDETPDGDGTPGAS